MNQRNQREHWGSKIGFIMAAAGAAVGLGNIWKFSYAVGSNGGGAFVIIYLIFVVLIGFTLMLAEFALGRRKQLAAVGAIKAYDGRFSFSGFIGVLSCLLIMGFYPVVGGWVMAYIPKTLGGLISNSPESFGAIFNNLVVNPTEPLLFMTIYLVIVLIIVTQGIKGGIEKASKILMPILFGILIIIAIRGLTLPGATAGLEYLFKPDFSVVNGGTLLAALGQAFFSLGVGMAMMITYGSYLSKDGHLVSDAGIIVGLDTFVAILAGIAIFPALFAFGLEPDGGPGLVFAVMPIVFGKMGSLGPILALLFFISLTVAAITSSIALLESVVAYLIDEKKIDRKKATLLTSAVMVVMCILASLSMGEIGPKLFGVGAFDVFDYITDKIFLAFGGMFVAIFAAWRMGKEELYDEISNEGNRPFGLFNVWFFLLKYVVPVVILFVAIAGIKSGFDDGYGSIMVVGLIIMLATIPLSKKL